MVMFNVTVEVCELRQTFPGVYETTEKHSTGFQVQKETAYGEDYLTVTRAVAAALDKVSAKQ